jgi:pimeloyl-ACP methyl ester carboxylesterase
MPLREELLTLPSGFPARVFRGGDDTDGRVATGRGQRKPKLVWFHPANGVNGDDPVVNALTANFDVYAPLAPGFHEITELDDIRDIHELAMYYDDLFGILGLRGVACVGHSFGGMLAAELAAHYPERVSKLVLCGAVGLWNPDHPVLDLFATPPVQLMDMLWADPDSEVAQQAKAARGGGGGSVSETLELVKDEAYVEGMVKMVMGFTAVAKFMWPIPDKGLSRRTYRITADTLVIWGAKDRLAPPEYAEDFGRLIPSARVEVLDEAGHMVTVEQFDRVQELIAAHCS